MLTAHRPSHSRKRLGQRPQCVVAIAQQHRSGSTRPAAQSPDKHHPPGSKPAANGTSLGHSRRSWLDHRAHCSLPGIGHGPSRLTSSWRAPAPCPGGQGWWQGRCLGMGPISPAYNRRWQVRGRGWGRRCSSQALASKFSRNMQDPPRQAASGTCRPQDGAGWGRRRTCSSRRPVGETCTGNIPSSSTWNWVPPTVGMLARLFFSMVTVAT